jgi:transcription elongation factor GreA
LVQEKKALSLGAAADLFLASLGQGRAAAQPEILKFLRWFGRERPAEELTPPELEAYGELVASGTGQGERQLKVARDFLAFARKKGLISANLAAHLRMRRVSQKRRPGASPSAAQDGGSVHLTAEGHQQLQERVMWLREEAVRAAAEIKKAAADKDFRENAPLEAARERHGQIFSRIQELESVLDRAQPLQSVPAGEAVRKVRPGSRVTLRDMASRQELTYMLVDPREANSLDGKLSFASPVGQALLDHHDGDEVVVMAPRGALRYQILKVE